MMSWVYSVWEFMFGFESKYLVEYLYREDEMFLEMFEEKDVVEIVKEWLDCLRKFYEFEEVVEGVGDVLIWYKISLMDEMLLLLRVYFWMLSKYCNVFELLLELEMRDMSLWEYLDW